MRIRIDAEVEGTEQVQTYNGESPTEAVAFLDKLETEKTFVLSCNMKNVKPGGEFSLARRVTGKDCAALLSDIVSWLQEHGAPKPEAPKE